MVKSMGKKKRWYCPYVIKELIEEAQKEVIEEHPILKNALEDDEEVKNSLDNNGEDKK